MSLVKRPPGRSGAARVGVPLLLSLLLAATACETQPPAAPASAGAAGGATAAALAQAPKAVPVPVRVAAVEARRLPRQLEFAGSLVAWDKAVVAAEADGVLAATMAEMGDRVRKGDPLARVKPEEFRLQLDLASVAVRQAELELTRREQLLKVQAVPQAEIDTARITLEQARIAESLARKNLADTAIRAPFAGIVGRRLVAAGEFVRTGQAAFEIVALDPVTLTGEIPERHLAEIHAGDAVTARVDAYPGREFSGKISRISPVVNAATRAFTVEAELPNPKGELRPGLFARLTLHLGNDEDLLVVPSGAVVQFAGVAKVFSIDGGRAVEQTIALERRLEGGWAAISGDGVRAGMIVAVAGTGRLADGVEVKVQ